MLKLPRSNSRRRRVSMPAIRRAFKTWKRWPRSGWNGWRISAHPKCDLCSSAVRAGRWDAQRPQLSIRFRYVDAPYRLRPVGLGAQRFLDFLHESLDASFRRLDRSIVTPSTPGAPLLARTRLHAASSVSRR
jgi:hypothetical protein